MAENKHKTPISGYNPRTRELFFSWRSDEAGADNSPDRTLVLNLEYGHASYMDHGFTSMVNYQSYNQYALRDFLLEIVGSTDTSICDCDDSLGDLIQGDPYVVGRTASFVKGGCSTDTGENTTGSSPVGKINFTQTTVGVKVGQSVTGSGIQAGSVVTVIDSNTKVTISKPVTATASGLDITFKTGVYPDLWNSQENIATSMASDSLCASLGSKGFESFCEDGTEGSTFVMASTSDKCLKQYETDYYQRDIYNGSAYIRNGYHSILESGALHFDTDDEKLLQRVTLEYSGVGSTKTVASCETTSGSNVVTCAENTIIKVGQSVSGTNIPDGAVVASVNTDGAVTSFTMGTGQNATGTHDADDHGGVGLNLNFTVPVTAAMKFGKANQPDELLSGINYQLLSNTQILDDQSAATSANVVNNNINPDDKAYFNNYTRGRYLGYQVKLSGNGPATISRVTLSTRLAEK